MRCIEDRALRFQGLDTSLPSPSSSSSSPPSTFPDRARLEPLQLVRYGAGEHFHFHTDWFPSPPGASLGGNRASSFFAYVGGSEDLTGGGTNFPALPAPPGGGGRCDVVDCDEPWGRGTTFRPVLGNAVFWRNLRGEGEGGGGDERTLHAGLPVTGGWKVGMNIWTREGPLPESVRGRDDEGGEDEL